MLITFSTILLRPFASSECCQPLWLPSLLHFEGDVLDCRESSALIQFWDIIYFYRRAVSKIQGVLFIKRSYVQASLTDIERSQWEGERQRRKRSFAGPEYRFTLWMSCEMLCGIRTHHLKSCFSQLHGIAWCGWRQKNRPRTFPVI